MTSTHDEKFRRCNWNTTDPIYLTYHDHEWGRPQYDSQKLFEMLCLEGMQAGLSWITILKRREAYREAFDGFDPQSISTFSDDKIARLMNNSGIIRNRLKINAIVTNARMFLEVEKEQPFNKYLWSFVKGKPIVHYYTEPKMIPASTEESLLMSKDLKKRGFKFVGPTICYAFMQATGMVNDHVTHCFCFRELMGMKKRSLSIQERAVDH
ncbi:DNA-3-methyladenine glycosylase I [Sporolactobacillus shoreicorticis]|uniref:DNA-3-methyladenine glycosylase I n=1 Tax=Sporolactobacillus shoreicorticis TaxID=1923877 RepID=A0ABW5RZP8_9BACL|nr:DNA-3-methyladenine glycosylase I [Sporolactobacillus shoreicorticis]MCO7126773.1 DNA-3-methyladenine glycosylase I [Sporolactobacillus shoreicorticis]